MPAEGGVSERVANWYIIAAALQIIDHGPKMPAMPLLCQSV